MMDVNWLDVVIALILLCTLYWGWQDGLTGEVFRFLGALVAVVCAFKMTHAVANKVYAMVPIPMVFLRLTSFFVICVLVFALVQTFKLATQKYGERMTLYDRIEKLGGACVGLLKGLLAVSFLVIILASMPFESLRSQVKSHSVVAPKFVEGMPVLFDYVTDSWRGPKIMAVKRHLYRVANRINNSEMITKRL